MRQLLVDSMPDSTGTIHLTGKDVRYLTQVLRLAVGETIVVRLPSGELTHAVCMTAEKRSLTLRIVDSPPNAHVTASRTTMPELWLFQCAAKPQKMDVIIRQATEIGVSRIIPVLSRFSFLGAENTVSRLTRWQRIIKEARQQSGSSIETVMNEPLTTDAAIALWRTFASEKSTNDENLPCSNAAAFILSEYPLETQPLYRYFTYKPAFIAAAIGSEGGFSTEELATFTAGGFLPLHFNTNILRTETAALYALAILQNAVMEYDSWHLKE